MVGKLDQFLINAFNNLEPGVYYSYQLTDEFSWYVPLLIKKLKELDFPKTYMTSSFEVVKRLNDLKPKVKKQGLKVLVSHNTDGQLKLFTLEKDAMKLRLIL